VFPRKWVCDTIEDQRKILKEALNDNMSLKESTISVLNGSSHLPFLTSIVQVEDFDEQYVSQRSNNMLVSLGGNK
jgi:hypothetical protein